MAARIISLRLKGTVPSRSDASSLLQIRVTRLRVYREQPRLLVLVCPCGCGEVFGLNLDDRTGPAWYLQIDDGLVTLFPSVVRESGCLSHS